MHKILFLDNQDSFTYNLVDELQTLGFEVDVYRNTVAPEYLIDSMVQDKQNGKSPLLFLSPGPGTPEASPCMMELIDKCAGVYPILGVCLGHQAIARHYGAKVKIANETVHGKSSTISLSDHPVFKGMNSQLEVARYHSLIVDDLPTELESIANYNGMTMALAHKTHKILGFQFHPESILTTQGTQLIQQAINYLLNEQGNREQ